MKLQDESPRAPAIQVFSGALEDELRREFVYAGDLLVFKGVEPMAELCVLTDELMREALGVSDPAGAQFGMNREDYVARVGELQKSISPARACEERLFSWQRRWGASSGGGGALGLVRSVTPTGEISQRWEESIQ